MCLRFDYKNTCDKKKYCAFHNILLDKDCTTYYKNISSLMHLKKCIIDYNLPIQTPNKPSNNLDQKAILYFKRLEETFLSITEKIFEI